VSDYISPGEVRRGFFHWLPTSILIAIVLIIVGGLFTLLMWWGGWWFTNQNVNRQAHLYQNGYANQTALHAQITNNYATLTGIKIQEDQASGQQLADLKAQAIAVGNDICSEADQVSAAVPLPSDQAAWVTANCANGAVSQGSSLRK
jgi:hypothetical protein